MKALILLLMLLSFKADAYDLSISEIRKLFQKSALEKESCSKLISLLQPFNETNNPSVAGYKACATMMMARHVFNPLSKWLNFTDGRNLLERCIQADSQSTELRFLRFAIQTKTPSFLGYNNSIDQDKRFLIAMVRSLADEHLRTIIISFLKNSLHLSHSEKQTLQS